VQVYKANPTTGANVGAWTGAGFGEYVAVEVTAEFRPLFPTFGFFRSGFALRSKAMMRSEAL
jgi:hypothetical protein